jgi:replicative DNA helicase
MSCMYGDQDRVEALRREIAEIQRLNLAYLQTPKPDFMAMNDHARREQRLREIMDELKSMTGRDRDLSKQK